MIRLNDVSLNCVAICHALIQYTHVLPNMYDFHWSNATYMNPHELLLHSHAYASYRFVAT